jgi:hypothetical protein
MMPALLERHKADFGPLTDLRKRRPDLRHTAGIPELDDGRAWDRTRDLPRVKRALSR